MQALTYDYKRECKLQGLCPEAQNSSCKGGSVNKKRIASGCHNSFHVSVSIRISSNGPWLTWVIALPGLSTVKCFHIHRY